MSTSAWDLTDEQHTFVSWVREAATSTLLPIAERGEPGRVNRELVKAMGDLGLLARLFPGAAAGDDSGTTSQSASTSRQAAAFDLCLLREAVATVSTEAETALALQGLGTYPVLQAGTQEQVDRWVPAVARGDAVAAFALSEPDAGSDAGALTLAAEPESASGDAWRLAGEKLWISNAPEADLYSVFARTTPGAGSRGVTAFAVPADRAGLTGEHLDLLSPHPIGRLAFDGVRVTRDDVLGEPDRGFAVAMRTLDLFRPSVGAFAVGMAQAALDAAVAHAGQREAFGAPLRDMQSVAHTLAEMATRTDAARLMVYRAGAAYDEQRPGISSTSAMAKLMATETAQWVVDSAIQIHGARALQRGHLLEHLYREVRAPRIYEGATEVQRSIIARHL
ncbi:MAG: acyl-CoA dehydrogenase family protein [Nocardioidaceae bacterium]